MSAHPTMPDNYMITYDSGNRIFTTDPNYYLAGFNTQQQPSTLKYGEKDIKCIRIMIEWEKPPFFFVLWNKKRDKIKIDFPKIDMNFKKFIYDRLTEMTIDTLGNLKCQEMGIFIISQEDMESKFESLNNLIEIVSNRQERIKKGLPVKKLPDKLFGEIIIEKSRGRSKSMVRSKSMDKDIAKTTSPKPTIGRSTRKNR